MNYEKEILELLLNPAKINRLSRYEKTFEYNVAPFVREVMTNDKTYFIETAAYLLGKAVEIAILEKIRPEITRVWLSYDEISEYIVTNLPDHLHELVLEMMDGCENAVEAFMLNETYDVAKLLMDVQFIGESLTKKYKLYDVLVPGFTNKEIATPQEIYSFASNFIMTHFGNLGYKCIDFNPNMNGVVSYVLEKDGQTFYVLTNVQVDPKEAKFQRYKMHAIKKAAEENNAKPLLLGVQIKSKDERVSSANVAVNRGEYFIRTTEMIEIVK